VLARAEDGGEKQWPETQDPIKISIINYTGQNVLAYIYGGVLEKIGYKVEYVQADYVGQWTGIAEGDIDVGIDMWETTTRDLMREAVQSGKVLNMGTQAGPIWETWWYPSYSGRPRSCRPSRTDDAGPAEERQLGRHRAPVSGAPGSGAPRIRS